MTLWNLVDSFHIRYYNVITCDYWPMFPCRNRIRQYPAFVNCTTIDWFSEWPLDALLEVAEKYLQEESLGSEEEVSTQPADFLVWFWILLSFESQFGWYSRLNWDPFVWSYIRLKSSPGPKFLIPNLNLRQIIGQVWFKHHKRPNWLTRF